MKASFNERRLFVGELNSFEFLLGSFEFLAEVKFFELKFLPYSDWNLHFFTVDFVMLVVEDFVEQLDGFFRSKGVVLELK